MKIFLIGLMGSGKSYWTDRLSRKLRLQRYDLDKLVEGVEDRTISRIFEESGEAHFREMESIVLKWFGDRDEFILATGGGTPCFHNNMEWMNEEGLTIWLDESTDTLVERLSQEQNHRPLIAGLSEKELKAYLDEKKAERRLFYEKAKVILPGDQITEKKLLSLIKEKGNA